MSVGLFVWVSLGTPASAQAQSEKPNTTEPNYDYVLRQNEDWSGFDPRDDEPWFGPAKNIELNDDGTHWLTLGGSFRTRAEAWSNFAARPTADDTFLLTRVRMHADLHLGPAVRFFVEGKSALSTDRNLPGGQRTLDVDAIALQQAFVDLTLIDRPGLSLTLRPGRQMLRFGRQRLISPLPWGNSLRAWDGVSAEIKTNGWTFSPFWTQFAPVQKYGFNDTDQDQQFYGVYATGPLTQDGINLDTYFIGLDNDGPTTFNGTVGGEERYTVGGRLHGKLVAGLGFDLEGAYQFGEIGGGEIAAYMLSAELNYALSNGLQPSSISIGFDYASGDDGIGGDVQTFNQLFPLGHAYFGAIDAIGRQNILSGHIGMTLKPTEAWTLSAKGFVFWRASDADAVYNAGGGILVPSGVSTDTYVGSEIDLRAVYRLNRNTTLEAGYSHFFAGDVIDNGLAQSRDIDFVYAQMVFVF